MMVMASNLVKIKDQIKDIEQIQGIVSSVYYEFALDNKSNRQRITHREISKSLKSRRMEKSYFLNIKHC